MRTWVLIFAASALAFSCSSGQTSSHRSSPVLSLRGGEMVSEVVNKRILACGGSVSDGAGFTAAIVDGGKLLMWGNGESGTLGADDGSNEHKDVPNEVLLPADTAVVHVACGGKHSAAITSEGKLYTWGTGFCGQLGHGSGENKAQPTLLEGSLAGLTIKEVHCGETHSVCLTSDNKVFTWGLDIEGQLGHGPSGHRAVPTQVMGEIGELKVSNIACGIGPGGPGHTAAISDGKLYTWGMGRDGQLGHGDTEPRLVPTLVGGVLAGKKVVGVSCGATHTAALTDDGKIYTWGGGVSGQLGHGDKERRLEPALVTGVLEHKKMSGVSCGGYHTVALMMDGRVFSWGEGLNGQLGIGGSDAVTTPSELVGLTATSVTAGPFHSAAATTDGRIVTWGYNKDGQLGHADTISKEIPTEVRGLRAAALR